MEPLPAYLLNHHAAQDAGHFTPYPTPTMKTRHPLPIVTNARRGLPVSTANTRRTATGKRPQRGPVNRPVVIIGLALVAFWIVAGLIVACAR